MIQTEVGPMDGNTWENLIQSIYKNRYRGGTYQKMIASPGDWGIEGVVLEEGIVIQCYCPDKQYSAAELYEKQRQKVTKDLQKLIDYKTQIKERLGNYKVNQWILITPIVPKNDLMAHCRRKQKYIKEQNLSFISEDFIVLYHEIDDYIQEIRDIQAINGEKLCFTSSAKNKIAEPTTCTEYDVNIRDKNKARSYTNNKYKQDDHDWLIKNTTEHYLNGYEILRNIYNQSPELYYRLTKLLNNFEGDVEETSRFWQDSPQNLIDTLKSKLLSRFNKDSYISKVEHEDLEIIAKHMIARWIAECPMRINNEFSEL